MKNLILSICLMLTAIMSTEAEEFLSTEEFTARFLEYLQAQDIGKKFQITGPLSLESSDANGNSNSIFLDNAYSVYRSGTRTLEDVIADQGAAIKKIGQSVENTNVQTILPVIKPRSYLESVKSMVAKDGISERDDKFPLYYRQLNDDLIVLYVFDTAESMKFVAPKDVTELGLEKTINNIARRNLENYFVMHDAHVEEVDTGGNGKLYLFYVDENYDASVLFLTNYLDQFDLKLEGERVIFSPARSFVFIAGSADSDAIALASVVAAEEYQTQGYAISPYGYVERGGRLVRLEQRK